MFSKHALIIQFCLLSFFAGAQQLSLTSGSNYGSNLWLEIPAVTNGVARLVVHNVAQGDVYQVLSKTALSNSTWSAERTLQTVPGQNFISASVPILNRTNSLFFRVLDTGPAISIYVTNGLVEWNRLNDGAGTVASDASGNGNTLPLIGAPAWGDGFLTLNGSTQYGDAPSNNLSSLDLSDVTVCAWILKNGSSLKGIVDREYNTQGVGYGGWGFWVLADNHLNWWVQDAEDVTDTGAATVIPGQWTFVAAVWHYADKKADFYINGILNSSVANGAARQSSSLGASLEVGNIRNNLQGGLYAFDGSMRDVGIYNRALSAAEIQSNFQGSHSTSGTPLPDLLYYKMTESAQTNAPVFLADSSTDGAATGTLFAPDGGAIQWVTNVASIPASAVHFDGYDNYVDTSNSVLFNFTTNLFTINLWVRLLSPGGTLMQNGYYQANGWYLGIGGNYEVQFGTESGGSDDAVYTPASEVQTGEWAMVSIVRTAPYTALIYVNGIQAYASGGITVPGSSSTSLRIGTDPAKTHYFYGDIWLPQIWSVPLPAYSIADLYFNQQAGHPWPVLAGGTTTTNSTNTNSGGGTSTNGTGGGGTTNVGSPSAFVSNYLTNGLLQWNRLNETNGSVAADSSGNNNTFPLIGSPAWGSNCLTFNGSAQYGDAGSNQLASLDYHDMTICAWINKSGSSEKGIVDKSFDDPGTGYGGWSFRVQTNNHLSWWLQDGQEIYDNSAEPVPLGAWTFVAMAWNYASHRADFYINGIQTSGVNNGAANQGGSSLARLELGNMQNNASGGLYAFDGSMHDVAIYNRTLSAAEIESNYFGSAFTTNVAVPDLLYYKMTESALTNPPVTIADSSTHGGTSGTIFSAYLTTLQWVTNVASVPKAALHFNGVSTRIDTSNTTLFNFTTNLFTINLWVRALTANGTLMENGFPLTNGWFLSVGGSYQVMFGTETNGSESFVSTQSGAAQVGEWAMVTIVRTAPTNALIYINGVQAVTSGGIGIPAPSASSLMIGTDRAGAHFLDGDIWMPQIWGTALSPADIANLYLVQSFGRPWP